MGSSMISSDGLFLEGVGFHGAEWSIPAGGTEDSTGRNEPRARLAPLIPRGGISFHGAESTRRFPVVRLASTGRRSTAPRSSIRTGCLRSPSGSSSTIRVSRSHPITVKNAPLERPASAARVRQSGQHFPSSSRRAAMAWSSPFARPSSAGCRASRMALRAMRERDRGPLFMIKPPSSTGRPELAHSIEFSSPLPNIVDRMRGIRLACRAVR
jgi:hypothetical protein